MKGGGGCGHCSVSWWCTKAVVFIDMNNANGNGEHSNKKHNLLVNKNRGKYEETTPPTGGKIMRKCRQYHLLLTTRGKKYVNSDSENVEFNPPTCENLKLVLRNPSPVPLMSSGAGTSSPALPS